MVASGSDEDGVLAIKALSSTFSSFAPFITTYFD
jgi:hypothetical protein